MSKKLMYPQSVFAEMTRFENPEGGWHLDKNGLCYLVRNKTRIEFGHSDQLIGTVIMTNPGSYGLDKVKGWEEFRKGEGKGKQLTGYGKPDPTMQNIIMVVQETFKRAGKGMPEGYINIFNLSSIVCPKGETTVEYHKKLKELISGDKSAENLLECTEVKENLKPILENSPFVILGFLQDAFKNKAIAVKEFSMLYPRKSIMALDKRHWPSHPYRWKIDKELAEKAITSLIETI